MATGGYDDYDANSAENFPEHGWAEFKPESRNAHFQGGAEKAVAGNLDAGEVARVMSYTQPIVDGLTKARDQRNDDAFGK